MTRTVTVALTSWLLAAGLMPQAPSAQGPQPLPTAEAPATPAGPAPAAGGGAILPEMMRWLWRDHLVDPDPNNMVERGFRGPTAPATPASGAGQ